MGMPDAFDGSKADFSGMDGRKDLFISSVIHEAYVKVEEKGDRSRRSDRSDDAGVVSGGDPRKIPVFRADHLFCFSYGTIKPLATFFRGV